MSEKRKLKKTLLVRLEDEQYACITNHARQRDITANSLVRECLAGALSPSDAYQRIKPVKTYSPRTPPKPEYIKELYKLRESTTGLCGALVQYAIKTRQNSHVITHEEAEKLIPDVVRLRSISTPYAESLRDMDDRRSHPRQGRL